ncbi:unnamed protein product, partial [Brassica oleracea var. botrytis]
KTAIAITAEIDMGGELGITTTDVVAEILVCRDHMVVCVELRYVAKTDMVEMVLLGNTSGLDVERYHHISSKRQKFDSADAGVGDMSLKTLLNYEFSNMTSYELLLLSI